MADPLGLIGDTGPRPVQPQAPLPALRPGQAPAPEFKEILMKEIEQVNRLQQDAEMAIEDLHSGKRDDVDAVMMAKLHADTAFQLLLQVRNKLMDAYEEIKQIRV